MFASKNTFKILSLLFLFSRFWYASDLQAQQQPEASVQPVPSSAETAGSQENTDERRIERLGEASTDEWELNLALPTDTPAARSVNAETSLPDNEQNQELQRLLSALAVNPRNTKVLAQLNALLADVLVQANSMMDARTLDQVPQMLALVQSIDPKFQGLKSAQKRLGALNEAQALVISGDSALASQQYTEPENDSALYYYKLALSKDPDNPPARLGVNRVQEALVRSALEYARELDFEMTEDLLLEASSVQENQQLLENAQIEVDRVRQERVEVLERKAIEAMNSTEFVLADFMIIDLIALGGQEPLVELLRERLNEARVYGGFEPGQIITDKFLDSTGQAPEIIIIAAGSYLMGSKPRAYGALDNEQPRHRVTIEQGFGFGVREVSVAEFRQFIESTGYRTKAERKGKSSVFDDAAGRLTIREGVTWEHDYRGKLADPELPVLHVNLHDAQAYVDWLARKTGKKYRLPSEAEYEFVARAGGTDSYWWGEGSPAEAVENLAGDRDSSPSKRNWTNSFKKYRDGHWGPAPVGTVGEGEMVHPMGVYDIAGNVREWTTDCWHQNYIKAPVDGSAWVNPGCKIRVVRGGYWASAPEQSRAAFRVSAKPESYGPVVGIRIVRDL
jgi:formylglycine-generating enzyme required for sulfatase activity